MNTWDWLMIVPFRLRVCLVGLRLHGIWVWGHCALDDWYEMKIGFSGCAEDAYIEGWCRE